MNWLKLSNHFCPDRPRGIARHHIARRHVIEHDGPRPNHRAIANRHTSEDHHIAPHIDVVTEGGTIVGTILPYREWCRGEAKANFSNNGGLVDDQPKTMVKTQAGADLRFHIQLNAEAPFDEQNVHHCHRKADQPGLGSDRLRGTVRAQAQGNFSNCRD